MSRFSATTIAPSAGDTAGSCSASARPLRYYPATDQLVVVLLDDSTADPDDLAELVVQAPDGSGQADQP